MTLIVKTVAFLACVSLYFALADVNKESLKNCVLKCTPIILLVLVALGNKSKRPKRSGSQYATRIATGLAFSMVGDALLIWPDFFTLGMAAFAIAHGFYIKAFGFRRINPYTGLLLFAVGVFFVAILKSHLPSKLQTQLRRTLS